ncbi:hypothetical protein TrVGV298_011088 [Trichoderma virens]|nr:hypothetical protein TrVGV298_011088 [Trichoderma virens]
MRSTEGAVNALHLWTAPSCSIAICAPQKAPSMSFTCGQLHLVASQYALHRRRRQYPSLVDSSISLQNDARCVARRLGLVFALSEPVVFSRASLLPRAFMASHTNDSITEREDYAAAYGHVKPTAFNYTAKNMAGLT